MKRLFKGLWLLILFGLHALRRFVQSVVFSVLILIMPIIAIGGGMVLGMLENIWDELPEVAAQDLSPALTTRIYDRHGNLLDTVADMNSRMQLARFEELPDYVPQAFIAIEDERFYSHIGIDPIRIVGALIVDLKKGGLEHGASTITQQLIKNVYLSPEKTFTRKIREMILAMRMEFKFTKEEILEMYLNTVFFGVNFYGIESAAYNYFSKTAKELSVAEAASLAAVLKAPNRYNPMTNPELAHSRQRVVLGKMLELGYINREQYEAAAKGPVEIRRPEEVRKTRTGKAPWFVEEVKRELISRFGYTRVHSGGLRVYTTLDLELQELAEKAFLSGSIFSTYPLTQYPDLGGAFVSQDVASGDIYALVGNQDWETSQFNRATQARRQVGSAFKPIVYAAAFENGIPPNQILNDVPIFFRMESLNQEWSPQNYGGRYHGPSLLRVALEHSYNVTVVQLLDMIGVNTVIETARKLGIEAPFVPNQTIALGSTEMLPMELLSAYATFANQGIRVTPRMILRVEDSSGTVVFQSRHEEEEALSATTAYQVYDMLRSVVKNGSGRRALIPGVDVAGKTGTNQDYIDVWFVGLTPRMASIVTYGFNERISLGRKASSSRVATPVVGSYLRDVEKLRPGWLNGGGVPVPREIRKYRICSHSGLLAVSGCPHSVEEAFEESQVPQTPCPLHGPTGL